MGRDRQEHLITWSVSRHNSEQDRLDDDLAAELRAELRAVVAQPKYYPINPSSD